MEKDNYTRFRMSEAEKQRLKFLADYFGITISEYLRRMINSDYEFLKELEFMQKGGKIENGIF